MESLNVLVLGVGGNVSQGILKALAISKVKHHVIGACISPMALGLYTTNKSYVSPTVYDHGFIDWIFNICEKERVHAMLSGVEPVLEKLAPHADEIRSRTGAVCVVSSPDKLAVTNDKLATCQWLKSQGCNYPRYAPSGDSDALEKLARECGYPLVAKPCSSKSAKGFMEITGPSDLKYISDKPGYVLQELLGDDDNEYTVGCFSDRSGVVRGTIAMRRELIQGTTYRAEVGDYPDVRAEAAKIAGALKPMGPCNVQLRISGGKPTCFEINNRFSGTTSMRARLGFNDVEATLKHYILGEEIEDLPLATKGVILRYWNEMYVDVEAYSSLRRSGELENPRQYDLWVENYGVRK